MKQFDDSSIAKEIADSMSQSLSFESYLKKQAQVVPDLSVIKSKLTKALGLLHEIGKSEDAEFISNLIESLGE